MYCRPQLAGGRLEGVHRMGADICISLCYDNKQACLLCKAISEATILPHTSHLRSRTGPFRKLLPPTGTPAMAPNMHLRRRDWRAVRNRSSGPTGRRPLRHQLVSAAGRIEAVSRRLLLPAPVAAARGTAATGLRRGAGTMWWGWWASHQQGRAPSTTPSWTRLARPRVPGWRRSR